mmetsp:Transcript_6265/g.15039  ORF Transcript_6265/g.15039 Transcript_6265/m.15039 type:complete len:215 (+) Transcript_6265:370-1014(+)
MQVHNSREFLTWFFVARLWCNSCLQDCFLHHYVLVFKLTSFITVTVKILLPKRLRFWCAGFVCEGNPLSGNPDEWETMLQVCLHAPMRITRRLTPAMAEGMSGYVINIGSVAAIEPMSAGAGAYAAAKHGLRGWSLSSYLTLRHKNIKCVLINPGFVNTDLVTSREAIKDKVLPDRMIQPSDIADAVKFVLHSTKGCVPEEINLRLALSAYKDA